MLANVQPPPARSNNMACIADFVLTLSQNDLTAEALEGAQFCIVDWFGTALGARDEVSTVGVRRMVESWQAGGKAPVLFGRPTTPVAAALVNGTMAHALDFDDNHVGSMAHLSGPVWASAFAVAAEVGASPRQAFLAFVAGFEAGARLGNGGFGVALNSHHFHSTGTLGCIGAAVAASRLYGLDTQGIQRALGLAATQVSGLQASFGTSAKPFHAGKAAMNGVIAAQLAREGMEGSAQALEPGGGLERAMVQDGTSPMREITFGDGWELTRNTFKPYAACLMTHPTIDAARQLHAQGIKPADVRKLELHAHPFNIQMAGKPFARTPLEGKFSLAYCASISLHGHLADQNGYRDELVSDPSIQRLMTVTTLVTEASRSLTSSRLVATLVDGRTIVIDIPLALGNPGNPMSWDDMAVKFMSLTEPVLGANASRLLQRLKRVDSEEDSAAILALLASA